MHFRILGLCCLILSSVAFAGPGRSPAVEDFVGIEVEEPPKGIHGSESLYNLEQDVKKIEAGPVKAAVQKPTVAPSKTFGLTTLVGILILLALPLLSWMMVMNHMRKKANAESASNIELLEKYRQERIERHKQGKDGNVKKAS